MKVWITKYALSSGIFETEIESDCLTTDPNGNMIKTSEGYFHGKGREWHKDEKSAIAKAEEMKAKKIDSLKKQIGKLEKMKFD